MPQPFDYNLGLPDPTQNLLDSIALIQGVNKLKTQKADRDTKLELQKRLQGDLATVSQNPTPTKLTEMMIKYPQLSEEFKRTYDVLDSENQKARISQASNIYAAFSSGNYDKGQEFLREYATANRNSGLDQEAKVLDDMAELARLNPGAAQTSMGLFLASAMGPDKFIETFTKLQGERRDALTAPSQLSKVEAESRLAVTEADVAASTAPSQLSKVEAEARSAVTAAAIDELAGPSTLSKLQAESRSAVTAADLAASLVPSTLSKSQSEAASAAVEAKFAESKVVQDLLKKGWDITKLQEDIKIARANSKIAVITSQIAKEKNELTRRGLEFKLTEAKRKLDIELKQRVADVATANFNIDNMLNTADRILQTPIGVIENATGPISSRLTTLFQSTADFEALIENIDAQAFLAQIPNMKGMGALSDAEGKKVTIALQNLTLRQSAPQLIRNVREIQRLMLKARSILAARYGVQQSTPDTPAADPTIEELKIILRKYGDK